VPEEYAEHWQVTLIFLKILTEHWPGILEEKGAIDPADRRSRILTAQAEHWRRQPPEKPIIAAGSTGSIPATAKLLEVIAGLPQGALVLPGLDLDLDPETVADAPHHPQFGMMALLRNMDVSPADIEIWQGDAGSETDPGRAALMAEIMRPAVETGLWRTMKPPDKIVLDGVQRIDCPGTGEEAGVIALIMREALETPEQTVALVTPDRRLARRVASELKRWQIDVDDSAGRPLAHTEPGTYLNLTAALVAEDFTPVQLLSTGKHPLSAMGMAPAEFRSMIRRLEIKALRGPRPAPGIKGVLARIPEGEPALKELAIKIEGAAKPFAELLAQDRAPLAEIVAAHVNFAESLAAAMDNEGAILGTQRLWAGDAGEAASQFVSELLDAADALGEINGRDYPALLGSLMTGRAVRPRYGSHPRLFIWGPLEARLQHADTLILGGLNEGTWPLESDVDPWMSRPMRRAFGLPPPERRIGLAAHDFAQGFSAPKVVMTRAERVDGVPTVPSRWLTKLEKILIGLYGENFRFPPDKWLHWQALLDAPAEFQRIEPASYCPPVSARPRRLPVTAIETWMRDPYAIYARYILNLKELPGIDTPPDRAEYGTIIHRILDKFVASHPKKLPKDAETKLIALGREQFGALLAQPGIWAFWWPRFERIARWFADTEAERRQDIVESLSEVRGEMTFAAPAGDFTLTALADRIDRTTDGSVRIVDYKTGTVPSVKEVAAGFSPQLPLEAAIAKAGGFEALGATEVASLDFWRLTGADPAGEERSASADPALVASEARQGLEELVARFDDPNTSYEARPRPSAAPRYSAYEHLARIKEWTAAGGGEE